MIAIPDYSGLAAELEHEYLHLCQTVELLQVEQHFLGEGEAERLTALAAEKISRIQTLGLFACRIGAFLRAQGFTDDARGFAECILAAPRSLELTALRVKIAEKSREARQLNILNGALIEARLDSGEGSVARVASARGATGVHGADSRTLAAAANRVLGAA